MRLQGHSLESKCADEDFVLSSRTVDVSDANVCHGVAIRRWHACLEPPVFVTFVYFVRFKVICHRTFTTWILCIATEIDIFQQSSD